MVPPREPLVPDEFTRLHVDDRLDVGTDQAVAHGEREVVGERGHVHLGAAFGHGDSRAADRLGPVHRGVGTLEQQRQRITARGDCEPEARADGERLSLELERHTTHGVTEAVGDLPCGIGLVEAVKEDHELVAAEARDRVAATNTPQHDAGEAPEHVVADRMAERVVDVLERIDVGEDHRDDAPVACRVREGDTRAVVEDRAPRQAREVVVDEVRDGSRLLDFAARGRRACSLHRPARPPRRSSSSSGMLRPTRSARQPHRARFLRAAVQAVSRRSTA